MDNEKEVVDSTPKTKVTRPEPQVLEEGQVAIDKVKLAGILDRIDRLEAKEERRTVRAAKPVMENTIGIAYWEDKPVVGMGKFSRSRNDMGEEIVYIELLVKSGDEIETTVVEYVDFLRNGDRKRGIVKSIDIENIVTQLRDQRTGEPLTIEKRYVDGFKMVGSGIHVPAIVESVKRTYHVEVEETGEVLTLEEDVVNI